MSYLLFYMVLLSMINKIVCDVTKGSSNVIFCSIDEGEIWYIDVSRRFIRTFYDFSTRQLDHQETNYKMRVCVLEMNFVVDDVEHSEWFQLLRLKDSSKEEYFLVERSTQEHTEVKP